MLQTKRFVLEQVQNWTCEVCLVKSLVMFSIILNDFITCKQQVQNTSFFALCYPKWLVYWDGVSLNSSDRLQMYSSASASRVLDGIRRVPVLVPVTLTSARTQWLTPKIWPGSSHPESICPSVLNWFHSSSLLCRPSGLLTHFPVAFPLSQSPFVYMCLCFLLGPHC